MNKLLACCIPSNDPPEIKVNITCTCCASSHNKGVCNTKPTNDSDNNDDINRPGMSNAIERTCLSCCCRCKKLKKRKRSENDPSNSEQ